MSREGVRERKCAKIIDGTSQTKKVYMSTSRCLSQMKQVFRLENKEGTIPSGGGSAFLRWRFLPVEAKEYVLRVTVQTTTTAVEKHERQMGEQPQEQFMEITLKGVGYDPRTRDPYRSVIFTVHLMRNRKYDPSLAFLSNSSNIITDPGWFLIWERARSTKIAAPRIYPIPVILSLPFLRQ